MSLAAALVMASSIQAMAVLHPIVRAAPAGEDAAAYALIYNLGGEADRLVGVTCACAERVEIHAMTAGESGAPTMAVEPALALPPARLVEIQPGGARHLMLIGLRAPLVAGGTVPMTFRFGSGGHDTRDVPIVADTRAAWSAALAGAGPPRLEALAFLAGSCWRGTFPDGRQTDTHCFSPIYQGMFMQDRHVVEGAAAPYSGDTLYRYDVMGRSILFTYHASDGSRSTGVALPTASGGLAFPAETHRAADGSETVIRSSWARDGADAYLVRAEARRGAGWRELWHMRMVRIGPTPPR